MFFMSLALLIAVAGFIAVLIQSLSWMKKANICKHSLNNFQIRYDGNNKALNDRICVLESVRDRLAKYENIANADEKAKEMLQGAIIKVDNATVEADRIEILAREQASQIAAAAQSQAETTLGEARGKAKQWKDEAEAFRNQAAITHSQLIEAANKRAEEIAGSAFEAMNKAALFEKTAQAMKNIIEGYGDRYVVPERSLLDTLAEDFGHTQAGQALKEARLATRHLVTVGLAASCNYVEENRRVTAINFVIDAFNGKVDSILSRVKHDNAGTLKQEILDAFAIVNFNGKPFRDAEIKEVFLTARLEELKWAEIVEQLRIEEREEQRQIREQMREEERARREYEREMKQASKDEETLRTAMEKAQQQVAAATAEQRTKYEEQLKLLAQKLAEAEERNKRAQSMAEQTRRGHVYIISNIGSFGEHVYKIGLTRRLEPLDRVRELGDSSVPFEFDVHALIFSEDAPALEHQLHKHFALSQINKVNYRKEFFRVDLGHVREEIDKLGIVAKWTMAAMAAEYKQTLAIEEVIRNDPEKKKAWLQRTLELEDDASEKEKISSDLRFESERYSSGVTAEH